MSKSEEVVERPIKNLKTEGDKLEGTARELVDRIDELEETNQHLMY